jgi:hypothetical protein
VKLFDGGIATFTNPTAFTLIAVLESDANVVPANNPTPTKNAPIFFMIVLLELFICSLLVIIYDKAQKASMAFLFFLLLEKEGGKAY